MEFAMTNTWQFHTILTVKLSSAKVGDGCPSRWVPCFETVESEILEHDSHRSGRHITDLPLPDYGQSSGDLHVCADHHDLHQWIGCRADDDNNRYSDHNHYRTDDHNDCPANHYNHRTNIHRTLLSNNDLSDCWYCCAANFDRGADNDDHCDSDDDNDRHSDHYNHSDTNDNNRRADFGLCSNERPDDLHAWPFWPASPNHGDR